ncbi:MAG: uracil-DNA glycosylase [Pseudomonadota bacterium]
MPEPSPDLALTALTDWWGEMGVAADSDVMKAYARAQTVEKASSPKASVPLPRKAQDPEAAAADAKSVAAACTTMEELVKAITAFEGCPLKAGCQTTVVFDGAVGADIMVIGEGPGAEEDRTGKPFVGKAGQLLDRMLAAINLSREANTLITNVNYWRPPNNRNPEADELKVCRPFVDRMIEITAPKFIIAAGAVPAKALLGVSTGIMKLRGTEHEFNTPGGAEGRLFPILHPAFLLRRPQEKSRAWRDLQMIERRMGEFGIKLD